jgi:hypothetical protein
MNIYVAEVAGKPEWHVEGAGAVETIPFFSFKDAVSYAEHVDDDIGVEQYIEAQLGLRWVQ